MKTFNETTRATHTAISEDDLFRPRPVASPLSRVKAGVAVRIKELSAPPEISEHLREIGLGEHQVIRLLVRQSNLICQVCNARLALSLQLAQMILVEPLAA